MHDWPCGCTADAFVVIQICDSYKEGRIGISLTGLIPPDSCICPKPRPGFQSSYIVVFCCVQWCE